MSFYLFLKPTVIEVEKLIEFLYVAIRNSGSLCVISM